MTEPTRTPQRVRLLRSVVPIARTEIHGGIALTLFAIEDYDDGFDVACRLVAQEDHPLRVGAAAQRGEAQDRIRTLVEDARRAGAAGMAPMTYSRGETPDVLDFLWPQLGLAARDNLGNIYDPTPMGGGGAGNGEHRLDFAFKPALAPAARVLQIEVVEVGWTRHPPTRLGRSPDRIDLGPWVFPVDLSAGLNAVTSGEAG